MTRHSEGPDRRTPRARVPGPAALLPEHTITRHDNLLTVRQPVNVFPSVFPPKGKRIAPMPEPSQWLTGPPYQVEWESRVPPHDHEHYEVGLVAGGTAIHRTAHYETRIQRGDVIIVAPGQVHCVEELDGLYVANCVYLAEWLLHDAAELWREPGVLPLFLSTGALDNQQNPWVTQLSLSEEVFDECWLELRSMARESARERVSLPYLRRGLGKLIITLGRCFAESEGLCSGEVLHPGVQMALERIEAQASSEERLNVVALAREAGLSTSYFARLFKQATGASPMGYFQQRRIQHACWLLLNTDLGITDIAYTLGFLDAAHFGRLFKKLRGSSPKTYRERYRDGRD